MPKQAPTRKKPAVPSVLSARALATAEASRGGRGPTAGEVFITRQVHFNSAHRLHNPGKAAAWNRQQYGACNTLHGHNYVLEVTVRGRPDPLTGYVVDLGDLKGIMEQAVAHPCDHRNLEDVSFLKGILPSTENLVIAFWKQLAKHIRPPATLHGIRLYETPRNFAEYFGPEQ